MRYKGKKAKAWEAVKKAIRATESDCYTCEKTDLIANGFKADSGHYMPVALVGSNNTCSWDRRFIHLQCSHCNGAGQGMQVQYRNHLLRDYGKAIVEEFERQCARTSPVKDWDAVRREYEEIHLHEVQATSWTSHLGSRKKSVAV